MKILSIDYDYFQTAGAETFEECYPDGIDRTPDESARIWSDILSDEKVHKRVSRVHLNGYEMRYAREIIRSQERNIPVTAVCSHREMYGFAHSLAKPCESLEVVNVDMHHDMFNDNPQVDCGNWVTALQSEYEQFKFKWVANPIGLDIYGFDNGETRNLISTSLKRMVGKKFDALFLCRSDNWVAPHLDYGFKELLETCQSHFIAVKAEKSILNERVIVLNEKKKEGISRE